MYMQKYTFKTILFLQNFLVHCIDCFCQFAIAIKFNNFFVNTIPIWRFSIISLVSENDN